MTGVASNINADAHTRRTWLLSRIVGRPSQDNIKFLAP